MKVNGLPPGTPVTGSISIGSGETGTVPLEAVRDTAALGAAEALITFSSGRVRGMDSGSCVDFV